MKDSVLDSIQRPTLREVIYQCCRARGGPTMGILPRAVQQNLEDGQKVFKM